MNPRIMRLLLYLCFILAAGCSNSDPSGTNNPSNSTGNAAVFNPLTGDVPLPNVLATAMAKNPLTNTLSAGDPVVRAASSPMTPPEALSYINYYEVNSTSAVSGVNAPIYIRFGSPVDVATVTAANIKVFQLAADTSSTSATENNPLGFKDISGMFTFKYSAGSTDLFLFPNFPMSPATRYLYVVSNRVKDAATGNPVTSSPYFDILKSTFPLVGAFAALEPIRANAMNGTDIKLSGYAKVMDDLIAASATTTITSRDNIALMGRFITTGAGFVSKDAIGTMIPVESALRAFAAGAALGGLTGKTWTNAVNGAATIPAAAYWTAVTGSTTTLPASLANVVTGTVNSAQLSMDPVAVRANAAAAGGDLSGVSGAYHHAAGVLQAFRDSSGNLTSYYHTPLSVPFVLMIPAAPNGKVIIFQHGITGRKEQVVAVTGALTAAGYTVAAIDLPLHGDLAVHPTDSEWGQDFMAVGAPLATRTNIQQGAFNLNRLELTMRTGGFAAQGIIPSPTVDIKYVSLSLGSIVGSYYLAGNTTMSTSGYPYTQTTLNSDMKGFFSVPGGRLAYLMQNSPAFSPTINAGLAAVGITAGTPTYNSFFQVTQSVVDTADPATMTTPILPDLPSRLSGRIAIQEAVGDQVIPNENTRYLGNALGGREVLGSAANSVAPGFKQLGYLGTATPRIPSSFMYTLASGLVPKVGFAAANSSGSATPAEGYFQFDQSGIGHGFLLDNTTPANTALAQSQMVQFLLYGGIVDPTSSSTPAKRALPAPIPSIYTGVRLPAVLNILGY
ncbi:MAG: hypothetical protein PHI31_01015 [Desulfuromonadaceae bacterium]|nr:hypothetical protein [Desulfuromonadaceae bacterium]